MKCFDGRVNLPLECCEKKLGDRQGYHTYLFRHRGVLLWYTSPRTEWGEAITYAPEDPDTPLLYWDFYGSNVKCGMWLARTRWWLGIKQRSAPPWRKVHFFHATVEEALDRLVAEAVKLKLQEGDDEE